MRWVRGRRRRVWSRAAVHAVRAVLALGKLRPGASVVAMAVGEPLGVAPGARVFASARGGGRRRRGRCGRWQARRQARRRRRRRRRRRWRRRRRVAWRWARRDGRGRPRRRRRRWIWRRGRHDRALRSHAPPVAVVADQRPFRVDARDGRLTASNPHGKLIAAVDSPCAQLGARDRAAVARARAQQRHVFSERAQRLVRADRVEHRLGRRRNDNDVAVGRPERLQLSAPRATERVEVAGGGPPGAGGGDDRVRCIRRRRHEGHQRDRKRQVCPIRGEFDLPALRLDAGEESRLQGGVEAHERAEGALEGRLWTRDAEVSGVARLGRVEATRRSGFGVQVIELDRASRGVVRGGHGRGVRVRTVRLAAGRVVRVRLKEAVEPPPRHEHRRASARGDLGACARGAAEVDGHRRWSDVSRGVYRDGHSIVHGGREGGHA